MLTIISVIIVAVLVAATAAIVTPVIITKNTAGIVLPTKKD
jgi:hypothetical protein